MAKLQSSSHLVLFTLSENSEQLWIDLGRTLERFLLTATGLGLSCAYLNQPCEVKLLADEMMSNLPIHNEYPVLILRIGFASPIAYSPRKAIERMLECFFLDMLLPLSNRCNNKLIKLK